MRTLRSRLYTGQAPAFLPRCADMTNQTEIADSILNVIGNEPISMLSIARRSRVHRDTVKKYLELIQLLQSSKKIKLEKVGYRVMVRKDDELACRKPELLRK